MSTPKSGTIQHHDLQPIYITHSAVYNFWTEWGILIAWLVGITAAVTGYNIGACALGRFVLDHFRLWNRAIPPSASEMDKHAELIAALLAGWLSAPMSLGLVYIFFACVVDWLTRRNRIFQILDGSFGIVIIVLLTEWSLLLVVGAMLHPRFHYVDPVSLLGVYFFGSLLLVSWMGPLTWLGYRAFRRRHR